MDDDERERPAIEYARIAFLDLLDNTDMTSTDIRDALATAWATGYTNGHHRGQWAERAASRGDE